MKKLPLLPVGQRGIGEAIVRKFAREGARVMVVGMEQDPVDDVVEIVNQDGGIAMAFKGDIAVENDAQSCIQKCVETWGRLDILINNAGVFPG